MIRRERRRRRKGRRKGMALRVLGKLAVRTWRS